MTHILHANFEDAEGRSLQLDFDLTDEDATQPERRAKAISDATAYGIGRSWTLKDWAIYGP